MGLFDLFRKKEIKTEAKTVKAPIECRIGDLLEIERRLEAENVWLDILVFTYKGEVHRMGQMFQNGDVLTGNEEEKEAAYVFDKTFHKSLEDMISASVLSNENEFITLLGYGSDEYDDAIDCIVEDDFYLDGEGEYWKLKQESV